MPHDDAPNPAPRAETFAATTIYPMDGGRLGDPAASGGHAPLTEDDALRVAPYWSAVRFLSETLATLPAAVHVRDGAGRRPAREHPAHKLLADEPSELATPATLFETFWSHVVQRGNGYLLIDRDPQGRPVGLYNLPPDRVQPMRVGGKTWYAVATAEGRAKPLRADLVAQVAGLGYDGLQGYSPAEYAAETLGLGRAAHRWAQKYYESGAHLGGVVSTDSILTDEQLADARREINSRHAGLDNAGKWLILQGGAKAQPLGNPPESSKLVEVLQLTTLQVSQLLRIPPVHLYDYGRATWGNAQEMDRHLVTYTLRPWIVKAEQELRRKLLTPAERAAGFYVHLNPDALLRGAHKDRMDSYRLGLSEGIYTANEVRAWEDLPPAGPEGDRLRVPANSVPLDRLGRATPAVTTSDEPAAPADEADANA